MALRDNFASHTDRGEEWRYADPTGWWRDADLLTPARHAGKTVA